MSRIRGGIIGTNIVPSLVAAGGIWTMREAENLKRLNTWPRTDKFLFVASAYTNGNPMLEGNTIGNTYSSSGSGTLVSPAVIVVGGLHNSTNRVWLGVNESGTLTYHFSVSSEDGYDFADLFLHPGPPSASPSGLTTIVDFINGEDARTGSVSVTKGSFVVVQYRKDGSADEGSDIARLSAYIT